MIGIERTAYNPSKEVMKYFFVKKAYDKMNLETVF